MLYNIGEEGVMWMNYVAMMFVLSLILMAVGVYKRIKKRNFVWLHWGCISMCLTIILILILSEPIFQK